MNKKKLAYAVGYIALIIFAGAIIFHGFDVTMLPHHSILDTNIASITYGLMHNIFVYSLAIIGMSGQVGLVEPIQSNYTNISPVVSYTVSAYGQSNGTATIRNNGSMFGPDDGLGDQTLGINDAINAIGTGVPGTPAEIDILPGNYFIQTYVMFNKSNTWLRASYGAQIIAPSVPPWQTFGSTSSTPRASLIIVRSLTNSRISGGTWTQTRTSTPIGQAPTNDFLEVTGITIADSVFHFEYDHTIHTNITNFAISYTGYFNTKSGSSGAGIGFYAYIHGHDNYTNTCGTGGINGIIDGGPTRISYNFGTGGPPHDILIQNEIHLNVQMYGYDLYGGGSNVILNITISNPFLQAPTQTLNAVRPPAINFEQGVGAPALATQAMIITPHVDGFFQCVLMGGNVNGGWTDIVFIGGVLENAGLSGVSITVVSGVINRITFIGTDIKNNNQLGIGSPVGAGIVFNSAPTDSGTISQFTYIGGHITDDQAVKTQTNGITINHPGTGAGVWDSWTFIAVDLSGNLTNAVAWNTAQQPVTNLRFINCPGYTPFNKITNPFAQVNAWLAPNGNAATPTKLKVYTVNGFSMILTVAGGGSAQNYTITDAAGNNIAGLTAVAALTNVRVIVGWTVVFNWTGANPTFSVYGE